MRTGAACADVTAAACDRRDHRWVVPARGMRMRRRSCNWFRRLGFPLLSSCFCRFGAWLVLQSLLQVVGLSLPLFGGRGLRVEGRTEELIGSQERGRAGQNAQEDKPRMSKQQTRGGGRCLTERVCPSMSECAERASPCLGSQCSLFPPVHPDAHTSHACKSVSDSFSFSRAFAQCNLESMCTDMWSFSRCSQVGSN